MSKMVNQPLKRHDIASFKCHLEMQNEDLHSQQNLRWCNETPCIMPDFIRTLSGNARCPCCATRKLLFLLRLWCPAYARLPLRRLRSQTLHLLPCAHLSLRMGSVSQHGMFTLCTINTCLSPTQ